MAGARKKATDAQPAAETAAMPAPEDISADASPAPAGDPPGSEARVSDTTQAAGQQAEINQYPDVIKRADFGAYSVRLIQDRKDNEMRIRFGEGTRRDKPSDAVLDWCAWMRNQPQTTGTKSEHACLSKFMHTQELLSMPRSAIETGSVDVVLPIGEIAPTVVRWARRHQ